MQSLDSRSGFQNGNPAHIDAGDRLSAEQSKGFTDTVEKFLHEHPYMTAAAGTVATVGVIALTRGKAAASAEVLAPVAKNVSTELGLLREAGSLLSTQKASLAALGKGSLPQAEQIVARQAVVFASTIGESPMTGLAMKSLDVGAKSQRAGLAWLEGTPTHSIVGSVRTLGKAAKFEGAAKPVTVNINTGERVFADMSKVGPIEFAKVDKARVLAAHSNEFYKQEYLLGGGDLAKYDSFAYFSSRPEVQRADSLYTKLSPGLFPRDLSPFSLRISREIMSPAAVISREGHVTELLISPGTSKAQISEAMAAALSAEKVLTYPAAQQASLIVQKSAPGFTPRMVEAPAESMQDMMIHALKGSSDWIKGRQGNTYTRFLRDREGNFTRSDRMTLHKLFTGERVRFRDLPIEERWFSRTLS